MESRFEVFKNDEGQWFFRFKARNGKTILQSEGYKRKGSAYKTINVIQDYAENADIIELDA